MKLATLAAVTALGMSAAMANNALNFDIADAIYFTGNLGVAGSPSANNTRSLLEPIKLDVDSGSAPFVKELWDKNIDIEAVGLGGQLAVGFQLHNHFALELGGYSFNHVRMFPSLNTDENKKYVFDKVKGHLPEQGSGVMASVLVDLLPSERFALFGRLGGHYYFSELVGLDVDYNGASWLAGVGAEVMATPHFGVRLEADARKFEKDTVYYAGLGFIWRNRPAQWISSIREEVEVERIVEVEVERIVEVEVERIVEVLVYSAEVCRELGSSLEGVNFMTASAEITAGGKSRLDQSVRILRQNPDISVIVAAHTDNVGAVDYNLDLSDRRAASVMAYLIAQGIERQRLSSRGYGMSDPIADNRTEAGRALNRRVELRPVPEIVCE